jgi:DNA invertase Pin-like site-specific DNA recombinase
MKNCAIYTRVSTSMQAEVEYNSCEAQKDRI